MFRANNFTAAKTQSSQLITRLVIANFLTTDFDLESRPDLQCFRCVIRVH